MKPSNLTLFILYSNINYLSYIVWVDLTQHILQSKYRIVDNVIHGIYRKSRLKYYKISNYITYLVNAIQRDWPLHSKQPSKFAHFPCCPSNVFHAQQILVQKFPSVCIHRWVHIIKYKQNCHSHHFHALNDLCKFIQAPC